MCDGVERKIFQLLSFFFLVPMSFKNFLRQKNKKKKKRERAFISQLIKHILNRELHLRAFLTRGTAIPNWSKALTNPNF